jgi:TrpR-related protein YerC/YecD
MSDDHYKNIKDLCQAFLLLKTEKEIYNFLKDLCTPTELSALAERWQICGCLNEGLSYREIQQQTGASLTTIGRVARFLKDEPYQGYTTLLHKINATQRRLK